MAEKINLCECGCGRKTKIGQKGNVNRFIHGHQRKHNSPFKKGKQAPNKGKTIDKLKGKNNGMFGKKRYDLINLNKSRIGIPISQESIKKQVSTKVKYWKSEKGKKHKKAISIGVKEYSKKNPDKVRERGILGHMSCQRISSQEIKIKNLLTELNIKFMFQYRYKLGVADFLIIPNTILFVDGDYWHGNIKRFPKLSENQIKQKEKDKKQEKYLIEKGFNVLRLWENEIKAMDINQFQKRLKSPNFSPITLQ